LLTAPGGPLADGASNEGRRRRSHPPILKKFDYDGRSIRDRKEPKMRLSARNQIKGIVLDVKKGATTSHVRVDIGGGQTMMSSITNEAVDELGIKPNDHVIVVIKASDVMIAVN
jgi:molybdopterin-binding protein